MEKTEIDQWCELPVGRLLSRTTDERPFVVVESRRREGYWIAPNGWRSGAKAAGPFRPSDALRAYRLANTLVPDGCELGPWQSGLGLFRRAELPGQADDWTWVDPSWLLPSVSQYTAADVRETPTKACCAPPTDKPRLDWVPTGEVDRFESYRELIRDLHSEKVFPVLATLSRMWNVHPPGSLLFAENVALEGVFVVLDLPFSA